jgi:hypothetical protein
MPHKAATHSLQKTLKLMICRVSGKDIENKAFLEKQLVYLWHHGDHLLKNNTSLSLKDGFSTVLKGKLVFFNQMSKPGLRWPEGCYYYSIGLFQSYFCNAGSQ